MHTMASRKNKISPIVWACIAGTIVLAAVIATVVLYEPPNYDYRGYPIREGTCEATDKTCWYVTFTIRDNPYEISFYNHPGDVDSIPVTANAMNAILRMQRVPNSTVYIALPDNAPGSIGIAAVQLGRILGNRYDIMNLNVKGAIYGRDVTCTNLTAQTLVITIQQGTTTAVSEPAPNCVLISAVNADNATSASEALSYRLLGVIPTYKNETLLQ
jgi:hypothetical protein